MYGSSSNVELPTRSACFEGYSYPYTRDTDELVPAQTPIDNHAPANSSSSSPWPQWKSAVDKSQMLPANTPNLVWAGVPWNQEYVTEPRCSGDPDLESGPAVGGSSSDQIELQFAGEDPEGDEMLRCGSMSMVQVAFNVLGASLLDEDEQKPKEPEEDKHLTEFREYWATVAESTCYKQGPPPVQISFRSGSVKVKRDIALSKTPTIWTPLYRVFREIRNRTKFGLEPEWNPILSNMEAFFPSGKMTLLLGETGSGKTTLLNAIAGRLDNPRKWDVGGMLFNGKVVKNKKSRWERLSQNDWRTKLGFSLVGETDLHLPKMTVRETLTFANKCRAANVEDKHVDIILRALGLSHCADTIVGNETVRGVSGGERRRVTIGEMWASNVRVFLADRLSDGLDSSTTIDVIKSLQVWCKSTNATVVIALNQPPPEVYKSFDSICLLNESRVLYNGPMKRAYKYLVEMGYEKPHESAVSPVHSPSSRHSRAPSPDASAQFLSVPPSTNGLGSMGLMPDEKPASLDDLLPDVKLGDAGEAPQDRKVQKNLSKGYGRSWFAHLKLCLVRQFWLEHKNLGLMIGRILLNLLTGLMTGSLWADTEQNQAGIALRASLIYHSCISVVLSVVGHIGLLIGPRDVIHKQLASRFYRTSTYWIACNFYQLFWGVVETGLFAAPVYWMSGLRPTAGAFMLYWLCLYLLNISSSILFKTLAICSSSETMALTLAGLLQVFFFLFSGYLIPWSYLPAGWQWARWIGPQAHAYAALTINEFKGTTYACVPGSSDLDSGLCIFTTGDQFLNSIGNDWVDAVWPYLICLAAMYMGYFIIGGILYRFTRHYSQRWAMLSRNKPSEPKPVALRITPCTLTWDALSYTVKAGKRNKENKLLLDSLSGYAKPGTLTALMGPSGAGKTTLLDVLAGRKNKGSITGEICVNGHLKEEEAFARLTGFVEQHDSHSQKLTVRETLEFSTRLRISSEDMKESDQGAFIDNILAMLSLEHDQHERVKDISVDQRKRLSVGVELTSNPSILFLDEPTTGLDGLRAQLVMTAVRKAARQLNIAVICTIHQPSRDLFLVFDQLCLLHHGGRQVYFGPVGLGADSIISYLSDIPGVNPYRDYVNPATWMLEELGVGVERDVEASNVFCDRYTNHQLKRDCMDQVKQMRAHPTAKIQFKSKYPVGSWKQFKVIYRRCNTVYIRSPSYNLVRVLLSIALSFIFGTAYWQMNWNQADIFLRLSWCYSTSFYFGLTFLISGLTVHMGERVTFYREQSSKMYPAWIYALGYQITELPYTALLGFVFLIITWVFSEVTNHPTSPNQFGDNALKFWEHFLPFWLFICLCTYMGHCIAALSPNLETGNAIGPGVASWLSSFAGFYLPYPYIPTGYVWIYWLNPFRYTYEAMVLNMFENKPLTCTEGEWRPNAEGTLTCPITNGNEVIKALGLIEGFYVYDQLVVLAYIIGMMVGTIIALKFLRFGRR